MSRNIIILLLVSLGAACAAPTPVIDESMRRHAGPMPADFSGSWQRNYARDDDVNRELLRAYDRLQRSSPDQGFQNGPPQNPRPADINSLLALARLADEITRSDILHVDQDDHEILVERQDDFALTCSFFDGISRGIETPYGTELCGWDGNNLVSHMQFPGGLDIVHRFTISSDGTELRVVTTLSSATSRTPFSLQRFYTKYSSASSTPNCIETLSMKRVCTTGGTPP